MIKVYFFYIPQNSRMLSVNPFLDVFQTLDLSLGLVEIGHLLAHFPPTIPEVNRR